MPFSVYRFTEFEVFYSSTVSVYRSRTIILEEREEYSLSMVFKLIIKVF